MNAKDDIKDTLKGMEQMHAPDFLEDDLMSSVSSMERKKIRNISLGNIAIFTALSAVLLFVSLALYFYVPDMLWLYEVKISVAILLLIYAVYTAATWLPTGLQSFMKKSK